MKINSSSSPSNLWQLLQAQAANGASSISGTNSKANSVLNLAANTRTSDSSAVSDPAKLLSALNQLSQSDPAQFKKIASEISQQLQSAAKHASDPAAAKFLNSEAANFAEAAQSGKFSDLFTKQSNPAVGGDGETSGKPAHHHHYGGGYHADSDVGSGDSGATSKLNTVVSQALSSLGKS